MSTQNFGRSPANYAPMDAILIRAQSILEAKGFKITYDDMVDAIYRPWAVLNNMLNEGDTISLPSGTTLEVLAIYKDGRVE